MSYKQINIRIENMKKIPINFVSFLNCQLAALALFALPAALSATMVFEANFNGSEGGTGGGADVVQLGGTGNIPAPQASVTASLTSEPAMGGGHYLKVTKETWAGDGQADVASFEPAAKQNSWASMMTISPSQVSLDGGFDFFFRVESVDDFHASNWFRPLDLGSSQNGNVRLVLNTLDDGRLMLSLISGSGAFTQDGVKKSQVFVVMDPYLSTGQVHHLGATFCTNPSTGVVTMSLFLQRGEGTLSAERSNGSVDFTISPEVVTIGLPSGGFSLKSGLYGPSASSSVVNYDSFRLYDSAPSVFPSIAGH
jgi:hypothetical protein